MREVLNLIATLVADSSILPESKGRQHRRGFRRQRTEEDSGAAGGTAAAGRPRAPPLWEAAAGAVGRGLRLARPRGRGRRPLEVGTQEEEIRLVGTEFEITGLLIWSVW